tara:strand:+ start:2457 stop:3656 length:1200 start_codon:yes stop_codon:yes gene_type:complete
MKRDERNDSNILGISKTEISSTDKTSTTKNLEPFWCSKCVMMSTRPRTSFNNDGECSACQWAKYKKEINWKKREELLIQTLDSVRNNQPYNCIVPVSGGKDGSYVSYNLKNKYGMNPLTVTVRPGLDTDIGNKNLRNFINSGYPNLLISPDPKAMRTLNRVGLMETGFSYFGWLIAIHSVILRVALKFDIPLIFYSEDGECEYGGDLKLANNSFYGVDYMIKNYMEAGYSNVLKRSGLTESELFWFTMPNQNELDNKDIKVTHFGFFENWDPYRNYQIAKKFCGLQESEEQSTGTYTNFAQIDQHLYPLHVYIMYLKFGFGRTTQDAAIDVRRGAMSREQAVQLVKMYDNFYPENYFEKWYKYYDIDKDYLNSVFDKWVNRDLFNKDSNGIWQPNFTIS